MTSVRKSALGSAVRKQEEVKATSALDRMTPREIVSELNDFIVGQSEAKKAVAIALRNRWRRRQVEDDLRDEILPNNLIMIGPTGVGKTEIARRLARLAGSPFVKVEASKFTEVGYVGRDVESMVRDLVDTAVNMVRTEREAEVEEEATQRVEKRLLDLLFPDTVAPTTAPSIPEDDPEIDLDDIKKLSALALNSDVFVAGPDGVSSPAEVDEEDDEPEPQRWAKTLRDKAEKDREEKQRQDEEFARQAVRRERTREKLRALLADGKLEERTVEIDVQQSAMGGMMLPVGGMEGMDINFSEMLQDMLPKRSKRRTVSISEARRVLMSEELDRLVDMDEVVGEALDRSEDVGIIFLDEIDKVAGRRSSTGPDVSREGVQRDLLPIVEGCNVQTKYGFVRTDHMLFIAAGAFHVAKPSDLIPELQGRFPIRVEMSSLGAPEFVRILKEPQNALVRQYSALVETEGATLTFTDEGIEEIARIAAELNDRMENIGARRLRTVLTTLLEDLLYDLPDDAESTTLVVTPEFVRQQLDEIVSDDDLSRYIL